MVLKLEKVRKTKIDGTKSKVPEDPEVIDGDFELIRKIRNLAGLGYDALESEHSYNRPSGWKNGHTYPLPVRRLFFSYETEDRSLTSKKDDEEEEVDVDGIEEEDEPLLETSKANRLLDECQKLIQIHRPSRVDKEDTESIWEEIVPKSNWTSAHHNSFNQMLKILNYDRLSRLTYAGHPSEAILRRVTIEETATRLRKLFTSMQWSVKLGQWLHGIISDKAPALILVSYLEAMQVLYARIPTLVNLVINLNAPLVGRNIGQDIITQIITKKSWDPVAPVFSQHKMPKLPLAPVFIALGTEPLHDLPPNSRTHHWISLFTELGSVIPITALQTDLDKNKMKIGQYLDELLYTVRFKIHQAKAEFEGRPIILVGINAGSALMCHAALYEQVSGVICLGFSVDTAEGRRGRPKDRLLELKCPILFVIGQCATTASLEDMEEVRSNLKCISGLIVVGGGDDQMRKQKLDLKWEKVNQDIVDRAVINEVGAFLSKVLVMPNPPPPVTRLMPSDSNQPVVLQEVNKAKDERSKKDTKDKEKSSKKNYYQERKRKMINVTGASSSESSPKKQKYPPLNSTKTPQIIMVSPSPTILRTSASNQLSKTKRSESSPKKSTPAPSASEDASAATTTVPQITMVSSSSKSSTPSRSVLSTSNSSSEVTVTKIQKMVTTSKSDTDTAVSLQSILRSQPSSSSSTASGNRKDRNVQLTPSTLVTTKPTPIISKTATLVKSASVSSSGAQVIGKDTKPRTLSTKINLSTLPNIKYLTAPSVQTSIIKDATTTPSSAGSSSRATGDSQNLLRDLTPAQLLDAPIDIVDDVRSSSATKPSSAAQMAPSYKIIKINDLFNATKKPVSGSGSTTTGAVPTFSKISKVATYASSSDSNSGSSSPIKYSIGSGNSSTPIIKYSPSHSRTTSPAVKYISKTASLGSTSSSGAGVAPGTIVKVSSSAGVSSSSSLATGVKYSQPKTLQQFLANARNTINK